MSYDITNSKGGHWMINNYGWYSVLDAACEHGWEPAGTVLYKPSGIHPDQQVIDTGFMRVIVNTSQGDTALGFEQATKSGEIDHEWDGDYCDYCGQIITAEDAANIARALREYIQDVSDKKMKEHIQKLINVLEEGACRIT